MKPEIKIGLLTGLGVCAWVLGEFALGFHTTRLELGRYTGYGAVAIPVAGIWLALRGRRTRQGGWLAFGEGFRAGMTVSVLCAVIAAVFLAAYNQIINPGWMQNAWKLEKARLERAGATEQQLAKQETLMKLSGSALGPFVLELPRTVMMGMVITVAGALALRREREDVPAAPERAG